MQCLHQTNLSVFGFVCFIGIFKKILKKIKICSIILLSRKNNIKNCGYSKYGRYTTDILYLTKTDKEGNKVLIGELAKNNNEYIFKYTPERTDKPEGFIRVPTFRDIDRVYKSDNLFLFFANRLFDKARPDLLQLLNQYGLNDYNEWELLKATKAKLMTDGYELIPNLINVL